MKEAQGDPAGDTERSGSHWRSRRTALAAAVVLVALLAAGVLVLSGNEVPEGTDPTPSGSAAPPEEDSGPVVDVENFPRGALAGEPAPDILLPLFDGSEFVLSQHLSVDGRPVVLNLWASWCTPCRREIPEFSRVAEANPDVAFVGAAVEDARGPAEAFAAEVGASYPMGIDEHLTVKAGYPFVGLPVTYLIAADGTVARQIQGQLDAANLQAFIDHDLDA
ncbi:MAG: TlpA disulfide reductase family protein [bacterium]|nr:TlpA disulfide reductase family protein [bacterium]